MKTTINGEEERIAWIHARIPFDGPLADIYSSLTSLHDFIQGHKLSIDTDCLGRSSGFSFCFLNPVFEVNSNFPLCWDAIGWARCSDQDNYCKATGRKLSLTNMLYNYKPIGRENRKRIWNDYFKECNK